MASLAAVAAGAAEPVAGAEAAAGAAEPLAEPSAPLAATPSSLLMPTMLDVLRPQGLRQLL